MSIQNIGNRCCGCGLCKSLCPQKAIEFLRNCDGYEFPYIHKNKCIDCNLCEEKCPIINSDLKKTVSLRSGAAYAKDERIKFYGSSGGLFGAIAKKIITDGGIVFGAGFDNQHQLKTMSAETEDELLPLYKSKYILSNTDNCYIKIKEALKLGRKVLFCSSPCQIHALNLYLEKDEPNLITVDFLCHGVGNQSLFDESIMYLENKYGITITNFTFRDKHVGNKAASHYYYSYEFFKDGFEKELYQKEDIFLSFPYFLAYESRLICRDECYVCPFLNKSRVSDITIGDFHSIEKFTKEIDRLAGVSLFVCNTKKGNELFSSLGDSVWVKDIPFEEISKENRFIRDETGIPKKKKELLRSINESGIEKAYSKMLWTNKIRIYNIYYKSPKFLREIARKVLQIT